MHPELGSRSSRTLAWLGDAEYEREVRVRISLRGDFRSDRLDATKAKIVRAEAQALFLEQLGPELDETEQTVVRRARNGNPPPSARRARNTKAYRAATGLEALVAHWLLIVPGGRARFEALLAPLLEAAIDEALA